MGMPLEDFITKIYCWIDDEMKHWDNARCLRQRGFLPALTDAEVITMEVIGEFLEIETDKGIWSYFKTHWSAYFPALGSRSQFAKQAANLWAIKQWLQKTLNQSALNKEVHIVDGFPIPVSHIKRARICQRFKGEASYGYCATKNEHYYGFKGHLLIDYLGEIAGFTLTQAHVSERKAVWDLTETMQGLLLADKGYLGADFKAELGQQSIELETPLRQNMQDPKPRALRSLFNRTRRRIETTIGQLASRFNIQRTWAKTLWSLTNRLTRKILSHSLAVWINRKTSCEPLQLANILQ